MKKINIVLMSIMTILLSSVLGACSFKKPEASFSQEKIMVSNGETINLDNYLLLTGLEKSNIEYKLSNPQILTFDNRNLVAVDSGKSFVYATYKNNNLASMEILVKQRFKTPSNFKLNSEDGTLSWDVVSGIYEDEQEITTATSYLVEGTYDSQTGAELEQIFEEVSSPIYHLNKPGVYSLSFTTLGKGSFDKSEKSQPQEINFGFMKKLKEKDLSWNPVDGTLTWSLVDGAKYQVAMDGVLLDEIQDGNLKDLKLLFDKAEVGKHTLSVVVYDINDISGTNGGKIKNESEIITIEKLENPKVEYLFDENSGGEIGITTNPNVEKYEMIFINQDSILEDTRFLINDNEILKNAFQSLKPGMYELKVVAHNTKGKFYKSNIYEFGKIYKMAPVELSGIQGNEDDSNIFNVKMDTAKAEVQSRIKISGIQEDKTIDGVEVGKTTKNIQLSVSSSGDYNIFAKQMPLNKINSVKDKNVYVINSDNGSSLNIEKLNSFEGNVKHSYFEEKSVFEFKKISNAEKYELYIAKNSPEGIAYDLVDAELYNVVEDETEFVKIKFTQKVDVFAKYSDEGMDKIGFKLVAKKNKAETSIASSIVKDFEILKAPNSVERLDNLDKVYTWNNVAPEKVKTNNLKIYKIDKEKFDAFESSQTIDVSLLSATEVQAKEQYEFVEEGYYYIEISTITNDVDKFLSSQDVLKEVVCISKKLELGTVEFGYDPESYGNVTGFTQASGYFVKVANGENIDSFEVAIQNGKTAIFKAESLENIYLLEEDFLDKAEQEVVISVIAHSNDSRLYVDSDAKEIIVEKLKDIDYYDLKLDDRTEGITVPLLNGASKMKIWQDDNLVGAKEFVKETTIDISTLTKFALNFEVFGSTLSENKVFNNIDGKVYLNSGVSKLNFERLQNASSLKYYNGNLTFKDTNWALKDYYVLEILFKDANDIGKQMSIKLASEGSLNFSGMSIPVGDMTQYVDQVVENITLKLSDIINVIKNNPTAQAFYNQATTIDFSVWSYLNKISQDKMVLSSPNATIYGDTTKTKLNVEKIKSTSLDFSYEGQECTLTWQPILGISPEIMAETVFQIYKDGEKFGPEIKGSEIFKFTQVVLTPSENNVFLVKVLNPNFLESNDSNVVNVYKLDKIKEATLSDNGTFTYTVKTGEVNFYDYVEVNIEGEISENRDGIVSISKSGDYTLTVKGKAFDETNSTYYIDSDMSTFKLIDMETIQPVNLDISYENKRLSWEAFGVNQELNSLKYIVTFKDVMDHIVNCVTINNSLDLFDDLEVLDAIKSLQVGIIEIMVGAYLEPYTVLAGGTMYYAPVKSLNDKQIYNMILYNSGKSINKLSSPIIKNVEYVYDGFNNAISPDIKVSFVGNYGTSSEFLVVINDQNNKFFTLNEVGQELSPGIKNYEFTLTKADYSNIIYGGDTLRLDILAITENSIPSSQTTINIDRANSIKSVRFKENNELQQKTSTATGISRDLLITLNEGDEKYALGGYLLKIDYQETDGALTTEYLEIAKDSSGVDLSYDMTEFFEGKLNKGGTIKVSVLVNNFVQNSSNKYIMSSLEYVTSEEYNVLKQVVNVVDTSYGFKIDSNLNTDAVTYIIEYGSEVFEIGADQNFTFNFPDTWVNKVYNLKVYAVRDGFIQALSKEMQYELKRADKIISISMSRNTGDLSKLELSWDAVSGASKYVFRMYAANDDLRKNMLYEFETTKNKLSIIELFGEGYATLFEYGKISPKDLENDLDIILDASVVGQSGWHDSPSYKFNARIKGNSITQEQITVNNYGFIVFNSIVGQNYLYRIIDTDGNVLKEWDLISAVSEMTAINLNEFVYDNFFNLEIILTNNKLTDEILVASNGLLFDSYAFSTIDKELKFFVADKITNIKQSESNPNDLQYELGIENFTKIYAGARNDSIVTEDVVEVVPKLSASSENDNQKIYTSNIYDIIKSFDDNGIQLDIKGNDASIYFWVYKQSSEIVMTYICSKYYKFDFEYVQETGFEEIVKKGETIPTDLAYTEDYANTFVVFNPTDVVLESETLGIYIKVEQIGVEDPVSLVSFVNKTEMVDHAYFVGQNKYVVNITDIFNDEKLSKLSGEFNLSFAILKYDIVKSKFVVSKWINSFGGKDFKFTKLKNVGNVRLNFGNIYWNKTNDDIAKYYVYFCKDLDLETYKSEAYTYRSTLNNFYNASDFTSVDVEYYLAVQAVSEDPYVISSNKAFVSKLDASNKLIPMIVYKNQIASESKLLLKNGQISFNWSEENDFYKMIISSERSDEKARMLNENVFTGPFTFNIHDLVNDNIKLRLKFTRLANADGILSAEGIKQVCDINAKYLLGDIYKFSKVDLKTIFDNIFEASSGISPDAKNSIFKLIKLFEDSTDGIINHKVLFDDVFEKIQSGKYKVEYALVGMDNTLNSVWYTYDNGYGENVLFVNEEPVVLGKVDNNPDNSLLNTYSLLVRKSNVWDSLNIESGVYKQRIANEYILKLYSKEEYAFKISKNISQGNFELKLLGNDEKVVSVYETDENGVITQDGKFLKVNINLNNGDSILGKFGDEIKKGDYKIQVFAIGTNCSLSSKSEVLNVSLLGFAEDFAINDGVFTWTPYGNRDTTLKFRNTTSSTKDEILTVENVSGDNNESATSYFSFEGYGAGTYNISFATLGELKNSKNIIVDSEIYEIKNVFKQNAPILTNKFGYISINNSRNKLYLEKTYSDANPYKYIIYNDKSLENHNYVFFDNNKAIKDLYYEIGVTGISPDEPDYLYKDTETSASKFFISSIGTTAKILIVKNEGAYHYREIKCLDANSKEASNKNIALRSSFSTIDAKMMASVSGLKVVKGKLNWDAVNSSASDNLTVDENNEYNKVVYKITIEEYKKSNGSNSVVETNVLPSPLYYYTTNTTFDFSIIEENKFAKTVEETFLRTYVQATYMSINSTKPETDFVELVEGGYGSYSNDLKYASSLDCYTLMSNGALLSDIGRISYIDDESVRVKDGALTWKYTPDIEMSKSVFTKYYNFEVVNKDGIVVDGTWYILNVEGNTFEIKFIEKAGELDPGIQNITIYVTQGEENDDRVIKSFGRTYEINKLNFVTSENFEITSDIIYETLDFSKHFKDLSNLNDEVYVYLNADLGDRLIVPDFVLNKEKYKVYIFKSQEDVKKIKGPIPNEYVTSKEGTLVGINGEQYYIVVDSSAIVRMSFIVSTSNKVSSLPGNSNKINSDMSENFVLKRSDWGAEGNISWNEDLQRFDWVYDGSYALNQKVTVDKVKWADVVKEDGTILYNDTGLSEASQIVLNQGEILENVKEFADYVMVSYNGITYYVNKEVYEHKLITLGTVELGVDKSFDIEENIGENVLISLDGERYLVNKSNIIEPTYIVEIKYGEGLSEVTRIYNTRNNYIEPTMIGKVEIKVVIKMGITSVQSKELVFTTLGPDGESVNYVNYNLFVDGKGTKDNPYKVNNATFGNISKRMAKDENLNKFIQEDVSAIEDAEYTFILLEDIKASIEKGFMFKGEFKGSIDGKNKLVEYTSYGVDKLTLGNIEVDKGHIIGGRSETKMSYKYGTSLFEKIGDSAIVKDMRIKANYKKVGNDFIRQHSLIAGLTVLNTGRIESVKVEGFESNFVGFVSLDMRVVMVYSGIASINKGIKASIKKSSFEIDNKADETPEVYIKDSGYNQLIFISGIVFTNYATIEDCVSGKAGTVMGVDLQAELTFVQLAGIAITNVGSGIISKSVNNFDLQLEVAKTDNGSVAYVAGIVCLGEGRVEGNKNLGKFDFGVNPPMKLKEGDISIPKK